MVSNQKIETRSLVLDRITRYRYFDRFSFKLQSFFGFGQSADIEITLDGGDTRKTADIKSEDGKKERHLLYYDGESVSGKVQTSFKLK